MSDYCRNKVVRLKASEDRLGVKDIWDLATKYPDLFTLSRDKKFEISPTESNFVDYVLYSSYGEECGDFGRTRRLSEKEVEKYIQIFKQICPDVKAEDLRYVDYCWYNGCEAPDYFDEADEFYDEI